MQENLSENKELKNNSYSKKAKKRLIIIILSIIGVIVLLGIASIIIDFVENNNKKEFEVDYNFYPADFDENIFEDDEYVDLIADEFITYTDSSTNVTVGIDRDNANVYGEQVEFFVDMIYDIINGDQTGYNARFSNLYYEEHLPKDRFTMQRIYDVNITYVSSQGVESDNGNYTKSIYILEYKISKNNGTFRRDIGEGSKKQYFTVRTTEDNILIDSVTTVNTASK